jgi:hypothetical protein
MQKAPKVNLNTNEVIKNLIGPYNVVTADLINLIAENEEGLLNTVPQATTTLEGYQNVVKGFIQAQGTSTPWKLRNKVIFRVVSPENFAHESHLTLDDAKAEIEEKLNYNETTKPDMSEENREYWRTIAKEWYIVAEKVTILKIT